VPTVWPIPRFEQSNALYALHAGRLLDHPKLNDAVRAQIEDLAQAFSPAGLGMSDYFIPDGDDTAEALAVLHAAAYPIDLAVMRRFAHEDHFCAYHGELQPSTSVTAHAAHTLRMCGQPSVAAQNYLVAQQLPDGRWRGDKWNGSWLYTTGQIMVALAGTEHGAAIDRALQTLLAHQQADGGWGTHGASAEETGYAVLALRTLLHIPMGTATVCQSLERAERWMLSQYRPFDPPLRPCWLGKEIYRPYRLARIIELAAIFPSAEIAAPLEVAQSVGPPRSMQYAPDLLLPI
jgi:hypothetical protein